jgi:hypothetical protein
MRRRGDENFPHGHRLQFCACLARQPELAEITERRGRRRMKRFVGPALLLILSLEGGCSLGKTAATAPCHSDRVQTSPGVILPLSSGLTYQVYPTDNHISMLWLPLDRLTVCPIGGAAVEITNLSRKNERIRAVRIYNFNVLIQQQLQ